MTDFSVPQRMSASALIIIFLKSSKTLLSLLTIMIATGIFDSDFHLTDSKTLVRILVVAAVWLAVALLTSVCGYFSKKFYINNNNLIFTHGILRHETTTIPLTKIHTLRTNQGLLYQILGLRGIAFDTIATKTEEIELILDEPDWNSLMALIEKEETQSDGNKGLPSEGNSLGRDSDFCKNQALTQKSIMRFSNKFLMLDALCQNHLKGAAILLGFIALIFDSVNDLSQNATETIADYTFEYLEETSFSPLQVMAILAGIYTVVLALWMGKVFFRYFDMSPIFSKDLLTFTHGSITRRSSRFSFDKICTIWVKRNLFERRYGLSSLMLRQALNVSALKEEDNLKIYCRDHSSFFLSWWLGEDYEASPMMARAISGKGVLMRSLAIDSAISLLAAAALCYFQLYIWLAIPAAYLAVSIPKGICAMRRSRIILHDSYIAIHNGRFADVRNYMKYSNIEVIKIKMTPFSCITHRVSLSLSTPGTVFTIRSLKETEALFIYETLLMKAERLS